MARLSWFLAAFCVLNYAQAVLALQHIMSVPESAGWRLELSGHVDVLGPFPIHAREQHFLSPAFPLDPSCPLDLSETYPSSYADGGRVGWTNTTVDKDGEILVSYPHIRWAQLRATEGWAALQHHSILRLTLTVYPPAPTSNDADTNTAHALDSLPPLLVDLDQGSFFALLPQAHTSGKNGRNSADTELIDREKDITTMVLEWYPGNIYAIKREVAPAVRLPSVPSITHPTTYDLFVSGDYEIRLFGDPGPTKPPTLEIKLRATFAPTSREISHEETHDIMPDFVNGFALGDAVGVGVRALGTDSYVLSRAQVMYPIPGLGLQFAHPVRLAPNQVRVLPLRITQSQPLTPDIHHVPLELTFANALNTHETTLVVELPVRRRTLPAVGVVATYMHVESMPIAFAANSPLGPAEEGDERAPVLALHGAGVDAINMPLWPEALPQQRHSWVIIPTGRTPWGLDWHGPSAKDAWDTVDALRAILKSRAEWDGWRMPIDGRVVLIGHSNGGQGAWHLAARWPDRVLAVVPAAGYLKAQAYVALVQSHTAHYIDPALRAILESSYTPDDNDLFLSNIAHVPILAVHGGADENVPTWHTREAVSVVQLWAQKGGIAPNITYKEDPGKGHWYDTILSNAQVQDFIAAYLDTPPQLPAVPKRFTLTVAAPEDSGSMLGWKVLHVSNFGRLARVNVEFEDAVCIVKTSNVHTLRLGRTLPDTARLVVDGYAMSVSQDTVLVREEQGGWKQLGDISGISQRTTYRASSILTSLASFHIIIPDKPTPSETSAASRIAHILQLYYALDASITSDSEALRMHQGGTLGTGNVIVIGEVKNMPFVRGCIEGGQGGFGLTESGELYIPNDSHDQWHKELVASADEGVLFLHPHPTSVASAMLILAASDDAALERLVRLFPMRTGIAVPDWLITTPAADQFGAAGIRGAGVWNTNWKYSAVGSWHE